MGLAVVFVVEVGGGLVVLVAAVGGFAVDAGQEVGLFGVRHGGEGAGDFQVLREVALVDHAADEHGDGLGEGVAAAVWAVRPLTPTNWPLPPSDFMPRQAMPRWLSSGRISDLKLRKAPSKGLMGIWQASQSKSNSSMARRMWGLLWPVKPM